MDVIFGDEISGILISRRSLGKCADCKAGLPVYCEAPLMKGITTDGGWAEYMVA